MARHDSNTIIKFAHDTTVVGLITDNNETAYREEVRDLAVWCQDYNLSPNVIKTKEMIVDYRKKRTEYARIVIDRAAVEQVESFKFLGVHITNKLTWSMHTMTVNLTRGCNRCPSSKGSEYLCKCDISMHVCFLSPHF
jgi:hypothetical protein